MSDTHKKLKNDGERMIPGFHKGLLIYGEHITRYQSVEEIVKNKVVLDIASGSGYGAYLMSDFAKKVIGVEINKKAVEYSKENFAKGNIQFIQGSAEDIPLKENSVDAVVSFETIEHIQDYEKFVTEAKRVLKTNGVFVVSTPNDEEFSDENPFHVHEFYHDELKTMLKKHFKTVSFSYQFSWFFTAIMKETTSTQEWRRKFEVGNYSPQKKKKAIYFNVVCSDLPTKEMPNLKELGTISQVWSARDDQRRERHVNKVLKDQGSNIDKLQKQVKERDKTIKRIYNSKGWRLLDKLHAIKRKATRLF